MSKFVHLHVHSHYSLLDGLAKIDDLVERVQELGMDTCALTDHGVLYGAVEYYKKAKKAGIKPIIGVELYVAPGDMTERTSQRNNHLIALVKNETGYKNLVKIVTKAHLEGFYYKPRTDERTLFKYKEGLIFMTACLAGKIPQLIIQGKPDEAEKTALLYQKEFGEDFYLELQNHPHIPEQELVNDGIIKLSKKTGIPLVATHDIHYMKPEDQDAQDILVLVNTGAKLDDAERLTMKEDDFSMTPPSEMIETFKHVPEAIENTVKIAEKCNFEFTLGETMLPYFETPEGMDADQFLKQLCEEGLEKMKNEFPDKKKTQERLEYELGIIGKTGYAGYFLIVQDFVNWAKANRIVVGPGRGSAGGSLVAYLIGIIGVNPIKHDLLFERFLNPERVSMPDIDLDFADRRRDEVIQYIADKYGHDHVAQIITFGTMAARGSIRDVGRALNIPYSYCDELAKMVPFGMSLQETIDNVTEFREKYNQDPEAKRLIDFSLKLEGCARHASTHACGLVISKEPLDDVVALQHPSANDISIVTQYEKNAVEDIGLLKMDLLGLKNLTIIEDTLRRIYKIHGKNVEIEKIPFDDKGAFEILQLGKTTGVFQLESEGMKKYLRELMPSVFDDIVAMVALYRPGPMQFIPDYIDRKFGKKQITYLHPGLESILKNTQGICIFQEQLMQIARELAGFTMGEADVLRKAVGKKIHSLLAEQKQKFIKGMKDNDIQEAVAKRLWEWVLPFAEYGFNKSHSVAYATIAYYTAYLKAHYPVEFMAALMTSERGDVERTAFLIDEAKSMGIEVLPPDVNESYRFFSVVPEEKKLRFGLQAIKNVGENIVATIIEERKEGGPYKSFADFVSRIKTKDFNKKSMESMIKAGVFDVFEERNTLMQNLDDILSFNRDIRKKQDSSQMDLFGEEISSTPEITLANHPPAKTDDVLLWEKELLGLYISSHPLESVKGLLQNKAIPITRLKEQLHGQRVRVGGIIVNTKKIITKKGDPMMFMKLEDLSDKVEVVVFPSIMERDLAQLEENNIVFVTGKVQNDPESPKIIADQIERIVNYEQA